MNTTTSNSDSGTITIVVAPVSGPGWSVSWDRRLKGALKALGRRWGFRCVSLTVEGLKTPPVPHCDAAKGILEPASDPVFYTSTRIGD